MRNLLILGICVTAASMAGWFQINREGDRTTIEIDRREIRDDARRAIDRGRDFLDSRDAQYEDSQFAETTERADAWLQGEVAAPRDWFGGDGEAGSQQEGPRVKWEWSIPRPQTQDQSGY